MTQGVLRQLNIGRLTREAAALASYRLELDRKGEVVAVKATSPREPFAPGDYFEAAADDLGDRVRRPGRPPISAAELEHVARIVRDAEASGQSVIREVTEQLHLTVDAAKKRIQKARERGFLPPASRIPNPKEEDDG